MRLHSQTQNSIDLENSCIELLDTDLSVVANGISAAGASSGLVGCSPACRAAVSADMRAVLEAPASAHCSRAFSSLLLTVRRLSEAMSCFLHLHPQQPCQDTKPQLQRKGKTKAARTGTFGAARGNNKEVVARKASSKS